MLLSFILLALFCILTVLFMACIVLLIPKIAVTYFGAPEVAKEVVLKQEDKPKYVSVIGIILTIILAGGIVGIFIYAGIDIHTSHMTLLEAAVRFLILFEGYKLFDVVVFDYFLLSRSHIFQSLYPELDGLIGKDTFGFNAKSQIRAAILYFILSFVLAWIITSI